MNVSTTSLSETGTAGGTLGYATRFQNNIQSIFQRVRVLYGGTVLEGKSNFFVKLPYRYEQLQYNCALSYRMDRKLASHDNGSVYN
jgi:hypothetical protein